MKTALLIPGLIALAASGSVDQTSLARSERLAQAQESLQYMKEMAAYQGYIDCGTPLIMAEDEVRSAISEGLLPPDTKIPVLAIKRLAR
jgi:hypothetical protein